jgi:UDP-glucose 4-epimerase
LRVLVTGGAGFIGSHIVDQLVRRGDEVMVVDDLSTGVEANVAPEARLVKLDIADPSLVDVARSFRPDAVSHCAAQASVSVSMTVPWRDAVTNIVGGINVIEAAKESGCRQFIYITTGGALYGVPDYLPCDEEHPIRPISAYGLSKWTLEQYLRILLPSSVRLSVLRLANVYGPRQDPEGEAGVVAIFGRRMIRSEAVEIFGDGEQTRDFVYAGDVARAHSLAQDAQEPLTVNISTGESLSVNTLFRLMAEETLYVLLPENLDERPGDIKHVVLDNKRARRQLGWEPKTLLVDGLRQTIASIALQE